jgi:signal transduction histidine kinase
VNDLIREILRGLESDIESHAIETRVDLAAKLPAVMAHKGQLQEVIINLLQNAIEAMDLVDRRRILKIRTELSPGNGISVAVEDTGPGLSSEEANTIFEAFVTTKSHGMGFGLAICRMIVERHEGQLSVSSADPRGAIFRIILPQISWSTNNLMCATGALASIPGSVVVAPITGAGTNHPGPELSGCRGIPEVGRA